MEADIEFVAPMQAEIDAYASNNVDVYAYVFDYVPQQPVHEEETGVYDLFGQRMQLAAKRRLHFES